MKHRNVCRFGISAVVFLLFAAPLIAQEQPDEPTNISFVAAAPMIVRAEPKTTATPVGKLAPGDIVMVYRATTGWLRVDLLDKQQTKGWIATLDKDGMIPEAWLDARMRAGEAMKRAWPLATKIDILRQRVRVGFTEEQARMALGDPLSKASEETATGTTTVWSYLTRTITFKGGRVASIKTVE